MGRHIHLQPHLPVDELERRQRAARAQLVANPLALGPRADGHRAGWGDRLLGPLDRPAREALQRAGPCRHAEPPTHDLAAGGTAAPACPAGGAAAGPGRTGTRRRPLEQADRGRVDERAAGPARLALSRLGLLEAPQTQVSAWAAATTPRAGRRGRARDLQKKLKSLLREVATAFPQSTVEL